MPTSYAGDAVHQYELGNVTVVVLNGNGQSRIYSDPSDADVHLLIRKTDIKQLDPKFIPMATSDALGVVRPVEATFEMRVPVGVNSDGRLFSESPMIYVTGPDKNSKIFTHLQAGKTVQCSALELGGTATLLPYSRSFSGTGYEQYSGIAFVDKSSEELPIRFYHYISENGMDGAKLVLNPINNEIIGTNISGNAVSFCGESISNTTLTEAISIYHAQRPLLTYNNEPFITAELTDSSITIVYMGKGEDGQYGVQKTTFGGITWKSETT